MKISAWSFNELVPPWIVGPVQLTCTCWRCENGKLLWAAAKRLLPLFDSKTSEETGEEEEGACQDLADLVKEAESVAVVDGIQLASSPDDVIRCCCCEPGEDKHVAEACITGSCPKCYPGMKRISNLYIEPVHSISRKMVKVDMHTRARQSRAHSCILLVTSSCASISCALMRTTRHHLSLIHI